MFKQIMVPVAAFAITATGASAFMGNGSGWMTTADVDLTPAQTSAMEQVQERHQEMRTETQRIMEGAGIDAAKMQEIRTATRSERKEHQAALQSALEDNDYDAFLEAIENSPLASVIDTEAEFNTFVEAHELMRSGDREGARELMEELGLNAMGGPGGFSNGMGKRQGLGRGHGMMGN